MPSKACETLYIQPYPIRLVRLPGEYHNTITLAGVVGRMLRRIAWEPKSTVGRVRGLMAATYRAQNSAGPFCGPFCGQGMGRLAWSVIPPTWSITPFHDVVQRCISGMPGILVFQYHACEKKRWMFKVKQWHTTVCMYVFMNTVRSYACASYKKHLVGIYAWYQVPNVLDTGYTVYIKAISYCKDVQVL